MGTANKVRKNRSYKYYTVLSVLLALSTIAIGCEGPTGPQGVQGLQGEVGPQGPQGLQGSPGTANVIYSDWLRLGDVSSLADTTILNRNYAMYHLPAPELTQEINDYGVVIVYYKLSGMITPLPFTLGGLSGADSGIFITFATLKPERITLLSQRLDNTSFTLNLNTEFRYILIPGGVPAETLDGVIEDYVELIDFFQIPG